MIIVAMGSSFFTVRNIRGTSLRRCGCGSWKEHWYNHVERPSSREVCAVYGCGNPVEVGAHVAVVKGRSDWQQYIAPFCHACNMIHPDEDIELKAGVELISANTREFGCHLR